MSKYEPLFRYLSKSDEAVVSLTFSEIEKITGFEIDHSFLTYKKESEKFGVKVGKISLKEKRVTFEKA